ncbi:hypothetical protein SK128_016561 [Halocaridina rubra]|uniref:Uncharacterized protein n=1 Tax=Halocaridina rubra TaxID=373956 RepID=A0AAN8XKE6_HALRR
MKVLLLGITAVLLAEAKPNKHENEPQNPTDLIGKASSLAGAFCRFSGFGYRPWEKWRKILHVSKINSISSQSVS